MEELHYSCSENKGAYQLREYPAADLGLLFSHMHKACFSHDMVI